MSGAPVVDTGPLLIEREQECAVLDALVDRLRDGGGTVVVRGEAGIGNSVLLQRVRGRAEAQGARPLVTVGVESEAEVAFAGLHHSGGYRACRRLAITAEWRNWQMRSTQNRVGDPWGFD